MTTKLETEYKSIYNILCINKTVSLDQLLINYISEYNERQYGYINCKYLSNNDIIRCIKYMLTLSKELSQDTYVLKKILKNNKYELFIEITII
jgi:hypothetical protein